MNSSSLRRPLGCLKNSLRQVRQQRQSARRLMATEAAPASASSTPGALPSHTYYGIRDTKHSDTYRTGFAVYSRELAKPTTTDPMIPFDQRQIKAMDPKGLRTKLFSKESKDSAKVGDVLMVTTRRAAEPFSGVCISIRRAGIDTAILLRTAISKVGVEMWYKIYSKNVLAIDIVQRRPRRARRARLTYMRQPKHDMGNVDQIVSAWRKSRNVLQTKAGAAKKKAQLAAISAAKKKPGKK